MQTFVSSGNYATKAARGVDHAIRRLARRRIERTDYAVFDDERPHWRDRRADIAGEELAEHSSPSLSARLPQSGAHNADIEVENQFDRHHWAIG